MNGQKVKVVALGALVLLFTLGAVLQAQAADAKNPYPSMAPIEKYLMDRTPRSPWREARPRHPFPAMPRL